MKNDFSAGIEKIKSRILFGTDWPVLRRMLGYRESYLSPSLRLWYK